MQIKVCKFSAINKPGWSRSIKAELCRTTTEECTKYADEQKVNSQESSGLYSMVKTDEEQESAGVHMYLCTQCGNQVPSSRKAFCLQSLDEKPGARYAIKASWLRPSTVSVVSRGSSAICIYTKIKLLRRGLMTKSSRGGLRQERSAMSSTWKVTQR